MMSPVGWELGNWGWGIASYALCHGIHLAWWHFQRPERDLVALFVWFLAVPLPVLLFKAGPGAFLVHFWLSAQYLAVYPAFQASSPTLHLLAALSKARKLPVSQLLEQTVGLNRENERELSLRNGGLVRKEGGLTFSGKRLAEFFLLYRRWLGLREGEG